MKNKKLKRSHKRSCKRKVSIPVKKFENFHKPIVPILVEPTEHDMFDELSRLDSFAYSKYNR